MPETIIGVVVGSVKPSRQVGQGRIYVRLESIQEKMQAENRAQ